MSAAMAAIVDQAALWHVRQADMSADEWEQLVVWLEADAEHARAYDAIALQDALIAEAHFPDAPATPVAANDDERVFRRRWPLAGTAGAAIAAALALWLVPGALFKPSSQAGMSEVIATRDGERRDIRMADGTQIAMNGGTVLRFDPADPRTIAMDRGEVALHVVHDSAHPFTLHAGDQVIRDMGTTFDVTRDGGDLSVAVGEGSVMFEPDGAAVTLRAGDALTRDGATGRIVRSTIPADSVGGWRQGVLSFDAASVAEVAASLRRLHGFRLRIASGLSTRPFTGIIHLTGEADRDIPHLADLIGATWRRDGADWVLAER